LNRLLEINNLHCYYGKIHAVKNVSLYIEKGEIVALVGGNGAGKTTILRSISGLIDVIKQGSIKYSGKIINKVKPHEICAMGLVQVLEGRHVFSHLTVKENLLLGAYLRKDKQIKEDCEYVYNLFPRLREREKQKAGTLSGGEEQMLAVGRGLMSRPKLLMMDEPSLGLAPVLVKNIFKIIERINNNGTTILLVEQNSKAALNIANRGYVIETGKIVLSGKANNLLNNEDIKKSYLGG